MSYMTVKVCLSVVAFTTSWMVTYMRSIMVMLVPAVNQSAGARFTIEGVPGGILQLVELVKLLAALVADQVLVLILAWRLWREAQQLILERVEVRLG